MNNEFGLHHLELKNFGIFRRILCTLLTLAGFFALPLNAVHPPPYQLAAAAVFQNETFYLKEWLEFHKLAGVEHFYLYNNQSTDDYMEVLAPYIASGEVDLYDLPFQTTCQKDYLDLIQLPAYNHALALAAESARWIAFIDLDEFLFPVKHSNLPEMLEEYSAFGGLAVNWQVYGTSWVDHLHGGCRLTESLLRKAPTESEINKIVKMVVQPCAVKAIRNPHSFEYKEGFYPVNSLKQPVEIDTGVSTVLIDTVRINHYWFGTQEFYETHKKPRREKWGFQYSEEMYRQFEGYCNTVNDDALLNFVSQRKIRKGKILHLSSDSLRVSELQAAASLLKVEIVPLLLDLPSYIDHATAKNIWDSYKDIFEACDAIITSDSISNARIFLQNGWTKPLVIWFQMLDAIPSCDHEFIELFRKASHDLHVHMIGMAERDHHEAKAQMLETGLLTIPACLNSPLPHLQTNFLTRWSAIFKKIGKGCGTPDADELWGYKVIPYENLDFEVLRMRKNAGNDTYQRAVYYDPIANAYVKIWSQNYPSSQNFLNALAFDYYEGLSPHIEIIIDKERKCRGYSIPCMENSNLELSYIKNIYGWPCLADFDKQNERYKTFYRRLLKKNEATGLYYLDLVPHNLVRDPVSYYLIDLESVTSRELLTRMHKTNLPNFAIIMEHLPKDYAEYLETELHKSL